MSEDQLRHLELNGSADYISALDEICSLARHSLVIFEQNFDGIGFNSQARYDTLHRFLLGGPNVKLHLLAHDVQPLLRFCPRMMMLLRQFSHNMYIYQTPKHLQNVTEPFAVADDEHYVRRFHFDDARGILAMYDPEGARTLKGRFNEMWASSHPAASASVTGL